VGDICYAPDASPLGTRRSTHKLVKWCCELMLNRQGMRSGRLLIIFGNRDIISVFKSLGIEVRDSITFEMNWNFFVQL